MESKPKKDAKCKDQRKCGQGQKQNEIGDLRRKKNIEAFQELGLSEMC